MKQLLIGILLSVSILLSANEVKPLKVVKATASGVYKNYNASKSVDGIVSDASRWVGGADSNQRIWLQLKLATKTKVAGLHLYSGYKDGDAIEDFEIQFLNDNGQWHTIHSAKYFGNKKTALAINFDTNVEINTDSIRLIIGKGKLARIKEVVVWPETGRKVPALGTMVKGYQPIDKQQQSIPLIYLNQSGFNLNKPKRFTAPTLKDGTGFEVVNTRTVQVVFKGTIKDHIGDFTPFNPKTFDEYIIKAGGEKSFPFRIGHWWLERITYQNAIDFMTTSRHYVGTYRKPCPGSFGWRDDHHFGWELNTLVPQYLSNPAAYERMAVKIKYEEIPEKIGILEPYKASAPDIVKLIHFGADIIVTQKLDHEFMKEQLAFFLYAWPYLKKWLPEQNYQVVLNYAFANWSVNTIKRKYAYDLSDGHNILALKIKIGTTKGELPPGHTVLPNLLMYEVAKREKHPDAGKYFKAAHNQVDWMIKNLDWNDPLTTKGQRMSEHVTMTGMALMLKEHPKRAPKGLRDKIETWKKIVLKRSDNMWDFRKLSATKWVPDGVKRTMWNEPGNVIGFPACALSAMQATPDSKLNARLTELAYSHMDNAFGRNPTGRHFSYDAPREIEGVELGWYSFHVGGYGQLDACPMTFDGSPKNKHYPYNPQVGDIGWSEGWVQHNTAFNLSLAYMAYQDTTIKVRKVGKQLKVYLKAPLNFDYKKVEKVTVNMKVNGKLKALKLTEEGESSAWFSATIPSPQTKASISYGYGYFQKTFSLPWLGH